MSTDHSSGSQPGTSTQAPPPRIAPAPQLSSRGLILSLLMACLLPLTALSVYAAFFGRATDRDLPVVVKIGKQLIPTTDNSGAVAMEVVEITSTADHEIPNVTIDLNGQYFLHRNSDLKAGETIVVPQNIFATKSNQRFVPGRYPITDVTVTGQLPSGARGVTEVLFEE